MGEVRWKANTPRCRLPVLELGFLGLERFQRQAPKRLRGLFVPLPSKSFHGACVLEVGCLPHSTQGTARRGNVIPFPRQNMREEGEGEETPQVQDLKERLETPSPIIRDAQGFSTSGYLGKAKTPSPLPHNLGGRKDVPQEHLEVGNEDPRLWISGGAET